MLTHKIKKPGVVSAFVGKLLGQSSPTRPPYIDRQASNSGSRTNKMFTMMGKMGFDKFMDKEVRNKYKLGDKLTLSSVAVALNYAPPVMYELVFINELWYNNDWDELAQQPTCLSVRCSNGVILSKAPAYVRKLTEEELALVDLSNTQPQGNS